MQVILTQYECELFLYTDVRLNITLMYYDFNKAIK